MPARPLNTRIAGTAAALCIFLSAFGAPGLVRAAHAGGLADMLGFGQCTRVGIVVSPAIATFGFAAGTSNYPHGDIPPDVIQDLAGALDDLAPTVDDTRLKRDVTVMADEIRRQAGHNPIEVTPALEQAMRDYTDWMETNCAGEESQFADASATDGAPAAASAPGVTFQALPPGAAAILSNARGISTGAQETPRLQVIFDPNAPSDAELWRNLRKTEPDLAVRWLPVAYINRQSAGVAEAILDAPDPAAALARNFRDYDGSVFRGGVAPADDAELGKAQRDLRKAWIEWGGYTPMLIVRNGAGSLEQTGGASVSTIAAALAEAGGDGM